MIIEKRCSIGTANHVFTDRSPVAYAFTEGDPLVNPVLVIQSVRTHERLSFIDQMWRVWDDWTGDYEGQGKTFAGALDLAIGKPGGGGWYAVRGHSRTWAPGGWD